MFEASKNDIKMMKNHSKKHGRIAQILMTKGGSCEAKKA